jgi:hypothetical protein
MRSVLVAMFVVVVVASAGGAAAVDAASKASGSAIPPAGGEGSEGVLAEKTWSFEPGEGFVPGWIGVQVGWTTFSGTAEGHIDTANPRWGTQHLRVQYDPDVGLNLPVGAVSPYVYDMVPDHSSVSVWTSISCSPGCGVELWSVSQNARTAGVGFDGVFGQIVVWEPGGWFETGVSWTPGSYVRLQIDVDPADDLVTYRYGGAVVHVSNVGPGTVVEQVQFSMPNWYGTVADFDSLVIDRGCVGWACHRWTFTTDASDAVGGCDALLSTGAQIAGGALVLDGVDDFAVLPIADTLQALTDVSVEAWVVWRGGRPWERLFDFGNHTNTYWFLTPQASQTGKPRVAITLGGQAAEQRTDSEHVVLPLNVRAHLVFTLDGDGTSNQGKLYMNGSLVGIYDGASALDPAELGRLDHIYLGKSQYLADPYFMGEIEEFAVYGAVLTASQVADLYHRTVFADGFESGDTRNWTSAVP